MNRVFVLSPANCTQLCMNRPATFFAATLVGSSPRDGAVRATTPAIATMHMPPRRIMLVPRSLACRVSGRDTLRRGGPLVSPGKAAAQGNRVKKLVTKG